MVEFHKVRDFARKELSDYLDKYSGFKVLVWDECLIGPMDQWVAKPQFFNDRGVLQHAKLKDTTEVRTARVDNIVFITRPGIEQMDKIAHIIKKQDGLGLSLDFNILFVPQKSILCEERLTNKGVFGSFTYLDELPVSWFVLEDDVISMEKPKIFSEFYLQQRWQRHLV